MTRSSSRKPLSETLVVGAGPVGAALVPILSRGLSSAVDLATRESASGREFARHLARAGGRLTARAAEPRFAHLEGTARPRTFYLGYDSLRSYRTVFLCTPADRYAEAASALARAGAIGPGALVVLVSAGLGSAAVVADALRAGGVDPGSLTVASLSNYFAATKHPGARRTEVLHKGLKRRVYVGLSRKDPRAWDAVSRLFESLRVGVSLAKSPLAAEARNITTYVHPPLFINAWALERLLSFRPPPGFMYKLHPEGPITLERMRAMARLAEEVNAVLAPLGSPRLNLLRFLNDDNYPVPEAALPRHAIESYPAKTELERAHLLFVRYATLQVDPFSAPDPETGKRRDFSAVPFPRPARAGRGKAELPRVPLEDYATLLVLESLARRRGVAVPTASGLCRLFERSVVRFEKAHKLAATVDLADVRRERARTAALILEGGASA
ncbi:MAG: opine metallophore biosynthesis dehydrogenase [Proteobacteria bacterium]|nr:opine metallophore biosynthesis dehydrogenase [Pseudomonadota bacterium]